MLIMRKHRNAKWDRKSRKHTKETVGDSDKFSEPFVLLTENVIAELKLHCQIRPGAGHGGTFHCNEMQNRDIWSLIWTVLVLHPDRCHELPACTSAESPWLPHTNKFNNRGTFCAVSACYFFIQGAFPPQSQLQVTSRGRPESLAPHHFLLRQLAEQVSAFLVCFQNPTPVPQPLYAQQSAELIPTHF